MKTKLFLFLCLLVLMASCQKDELAQVSDCKSLASESNALIGSPSYGPGVSSNTVVSVFLGSAPSPSLNGEVQLGISQPLLYPIHVHFKTMSALRGGNSLVSSYYTIPAGQRYATCDIEEYGTNALYLQICDIQDDSGVNSYMVNYTITKISYSGNSVSISFPVSGGYVSLSELSCSGGFYGLPSTGGVITIPENPGLEI